MTNKLFIISSQLWPHGSRRPLGEALGELIVRLSDGDFEVEAVLPLHSDVRPDKHGLARRLSKLEVDVAGAPQECMLYEGRYGPRQARLWYIGHAPSFDRDHPHAPQPDDPARFLLLAKAALELARQSENAPDALIACGWQAGFVPLLARDEAFFAKSKIIFAVDDPRQLGLFDRAKLDELGVGRDHFTPDGIEFHGKASLLKSGLVFADKVVLPSNSAKNDLVAERYGAGLHGLYRALGAKLEGFVGGMDSGHWSPSADHYIAEVFSQEDLSGKDACKAALQKELGLKKRQGAALALILGPFDERSQIERLHALRSELTLRKLQLVFSGPAAPEQAALIKEIIAAMGPDRAVHRAAEHDDTALHRLIAGADALVFADAYIATGLDHLKSLRYGAPLVGAPSGALRDVMVDFDPVTATGNSLCASDVAEDLLPSVDRLVACFDDKKTWRALQRAAMRESFTWQMNAARWKVVLEELL